ncbi:MAG: hypothetical protein AAGA81_23635 [Acidobacteriota bacterium]
MTHLPRLLPALLLFAFAGAAPAANPDFQGRWRIDLERSDPMNLEGLEIDNAYELTLDGDDLRAKRTFFQNGQSQSVEWTFQTDGKPHEIPGMTEPRKARVKWRKDRLSVSYTMQRQTPRGALDIDVVETWKLTKEGELEISHSMRVGQRNMKRREIYRRADD